MTTNKQSNNLPHFFIAGCQKCATTSLHEYLIQHPDIYLPKIKETKHFVIDDRYRKGFSFYQKTYFSGVKDEFAIGEVDPDYIYFNKALKRIQIHFDIKKLKFIFIFRNPIERAFSHYLMTYRRGIETKTFAEAIECEKERIKQDFFARMHFSYTDRGFYYRQLSPFMELLKPEQYLLLLMDDLKANKTLTLQSCFDFLGVNHNLNSMETNKIHHSATVPRSDYLLNEIIRKKNTLPKKLVRLLIPNPQKRHKLREKILEFNQTQNNKKIKIKNKEKSLLINIYKDENKKLGKLMGRDLSFWDEVN